MMDDKEFFNKTLEVVKEGREYLADEFRKLGFKVWDSQINFIYVDTGMGTFELDEKLKEYGIIIRGNFPLPLSRISIGRKEQNEAVVAAIKDIIEKESVPYKEEKCCACCS